MSNPQSQPSPWWQFDQTSNKPQVPQRPQVGTNPQLYGAYNQTQSQPQQNQLAQLFQQPTMPQQHPFDFAGLLGAMRNDPQGDADHGYVAGQNGAYNPFSNGFFQDNNQRIGNESARLGGYGLTGVQAGLAPFQPNPERPMGGQDISQPPPTTSHPFDPTTIGRPGGGFEGMVNPNAPQGTKYQDSNMFSAIPGVSNLPPGAVAGDERRMYGRPQQTMQQSPSMAHNDIRGRTAPGFPNTQMKPFSFGSRAVPSPWGSF